MRTVFVPAVAGNDVAEPPATTIGDPPFTEIVMMALSVACPTVTKTVPVGESAPRASWKALPPDLSSGDKNTDVSPSAGTVSGENTTIRRSSLAGGGQGDTTPVDELSGVGFAPPVDDEDDGTTGVADDEDEISGATSPVDDEDEGN